MIKPYNPRCPYWRIDVVVSIVLVSSSILLTSVTIHVQDWFSFELGGQLYVFGLFYCATCPENYAAYSTDCLSSYNCALNSDSNLCYLGRTAYAASIRYFWLSLLSLVCSLFLLQRLVFMLIGRDYGHPQLMYVLTVVIPSAQSAAVVVWFANSRASFNGDCSADVHEQGGLCAETGPTFAISSAILALLASGGSGLVVRYRNEANDKGATGMAKGKVLGISQRQWLLGKITPVLLTGLALQLMAICWHWVHYDADSERKGYLLYLDRYLDFDSLGFNCLYGPACEDDRDFHINKRNCSAFKRIWEAGTAYLYIDAAALLMCLLWMEGLVYLVLRREFGLPSAQYCWPILTVVLHLSAILAWFIKSEAKFNSTCKVAAPDHDIDFCADKSASFAIWSLVCYSLAATLYVFLYFRRKDNCSLRVQDCREAIGRGKKQPRMPDQFSICIADRTDGNETALNDSGVENSFSFTNSISQLYKKPVGQAKQVSDEVPLSAEMKERCAVCGGRLRNEHVTRLSCSCMTHAECFEQMSLGQTKCQLCAMEVA
jgi:hypothetical protein